MQLTTSGVQVVTISGRTIRDEAQASPLLAGDQGYLYCAKAFHARLTRACVQSWPSSASTRSLLRHVLGLSVVLSSQDVEGSPTRCPQVPDDLKGKAEQLRLGRAVRT